MASAPNDSSFITRPRHQSVFGVGRNWTLDLLYNHKRFYQLSWLAPTMYILFINLSDMSPMGLFGLNLLLLKLKTL